MSRDSVPATDTGDSDGGDDGGTDSDGEDLRELLGMKPRRAPAMLTVGQVIDEAYRIEEELGAGGMGRVYRAKDLELGRDIALKLHATALAPDDDSLKREAMALAKLTHPNVVTVYGVGTWQGHPWVAMEYVPGGNARSWLREAKRTPREILALYIAAGRGLAAAHAAGLVHRDFKPDNVLVGRDGRARVADFGLAREVVLEESSPGSDGTYASRTVASRGTPGYMAPEQRGGGVIGAAADQFAYAVAVWEVLSGARPHAPPTDKPDPGAMIAPASGAMPRHVEAALRRAMAVVPADRWPSLNALLAELERDPARSRRRLISFVAAGLAVAAGGWMLSRLSQDDAVAISCEPTNNELASIWSPARRDALRPALGPSADRVLGILDGWTERWRAQRRSSCEATHVQHVQSPAMLDLRTACLDRAHLGLAATIDLLATKSGAKKALDAATALPRLEECADTTILAASGARPTTPGGIASEASADALTARARALREAGQTKAALAAATEAVAFADRISSPAAQARSRVELASSMFATGKLEGVLETFQAAARLAAEAKDDALTARIWINVLDAIGLRLDKPGEAERLLVVAEAAVARVGPHPVLAGYLDGIRGDLAMQSEKFAEAVPLLENRIRVYEEQYGKHDPGVGRWLNRLATALMHLNRGPEAREHLDRAIAILEGHYGPAHPNIGVLLTTKGNVEHRTGSFGAALVTYERAIRVKEAALGPTHPSLVPTLMNLAITHSDLGSIELALATARRGVVIAEASFPPAHPKLGHALATLGSMQVAAGAWEDASVSLVRALKILEPMGDHAPLDEALRSYSAIRLQSNDLAGARHAAERAAAIATEAYGNSIETARALARLGRVQAVSKQPEARATLQRAYDMVVALGGETHPHALALEKDLAALR
ncbi:MAG: serine/threonine protein kinase [Deltaproteobacteria bacterium]|nr:serine/threonine protein kinase [Deltaproteobacteria bacterium]